MSHGQDFTLSSQFLFLSSEFVLFHAKICQKVVEWNSVPLQLVSPRCFPCRCLGNVGSASQRIDSCTLAAVLRQKQARRITGSLFFCVREWGRPQK